MNHWLYERISENDGDRKPSFSVQATHNWFRALSFEIQNSHGKTNEEQIASCREFYRNVPKLKTQPVLGDIFEPLFFSVINLAIIRARSFLISSRSLASSSLS